MQHCQSKGAVSSMKDLVKLGRKSVLCATTEGMELTDKWNRGSQGTDVPVTKGKRHGHPEAQFLQREGTRTEYVQHVKKSDGKVRDS